MSDCDSGVAFCSSGTRAGAPNSLGKCSVECQYFSGICTVAAGIESLIEADQQIGVVGKFKGPVSQIEFGLENQHRGVQPLPVQTTTGFGCRRAG